MLNQILILTTLFNCSNFCTISNDNAFQLAMSSYVKMSEALGLIF